MSGSENPRDNPPPVVSEGAASTTDTSPGAPSRGTIWWRKNKSLVILTGFVVLFLFAYLFTRTFITIDSGYRGVLFQRIGGTRMDYVYPEGLRVIFPLDTMYIYETRVRKVDTEFKVLSQNGLTIFVDLTIRFQPQVSELTRLHREVGPDYVERVVVPEVKAVIRQIFGNYTPEEIYASQSGILQNVLLTAIGELRERYVLLDGLMIREIRLPTSVAEAIQSKIRQQQLFLEYEFRLDRERAEAERKEIEAQGIAAFQAEISDGLTPEYLRYRGIEATLRLAESDNAKVVVVGGSEDGLPLILNMDPMALPAPTALEEVEPATGPTVPAETSPPASPSTYRVSEILPPPSTPREPSPAVNPQP